jgi:hypothetical protein
MAQPTSNKQTSSITIANEKTQVVEKKSFSKSVILSVFVNAAILGFALIYWGIVAIPLWLPILTLVLGAAYGAYYKNEIEPGNDKTKTQQTVVKQEEKSPNSMKTESKGNESSEAAATTINQHPSQNPPSAEASATQAQSTSHTIGVIPIPVPPSSS